MKDLIKNKKIGIVGGVGPQATGVLYNHVVRLAQEKYNARNNDEFPSIIIETVPVPDFISSTENIDQALSMLKTATKNLSEGGATILSIGSNTVHLLLSELQEETDIKFLSVIDLVLERAHQLNLKKVGLVGTSISINKGIYKKLSEKNIELITPDSKQQELIDTIIKKVLGGEDNGKEKSGYIEILHSLIDNGAEAIILGCTELPLAINYEALGRKVLDSMQILAEGLVDYYYSESNYLNK